MPLSSASRAFLTAALVQLAVASLLLLFNAQTQVLALQWDTWLWLVVTGFVGCSTTGFSLHLFPTVVRRHRPSPWLEWTAFGFAEAAVVWGTVALAESVTGQLPPDSFSVAAGFMFGWGVTMTAAFASVLAGRTPAQGMPGAHPGDIVTFPLFVVSWGSALVASLLFALSGLTDGPGFGWWLAAVHLYLLGHVVLLIVAVSLRLVPRSFNVDLPVAGTYLLTALAIGGAVLFPTGLLLVAPAASPELSFYAVPEALLGVGLVGSLLYLGLRSAISRPQFGIQVAAASVLLFGGGVGLWMVSGSQYDAVTGHAILNVFGFVGLTILAMWFSMIAPFQRVSHAWTRRMMWALAAAWVAGALAFGLASALFSPSPSWVPVATGALLLTVAVLWGLGTLPVLYPDLRPLPGLSSDRIRAIRDRWGRR